MYQTHREIFDHCRALRYLDNPPTPGDLLHFLRSARNHDPHTFRDIWRPYLSGARLPSYTPASNREALSLHGILPSGARLELHLNDSWGDPLPATLQDLPESPLLPRLRALSISFSSVPPQTNARVRRTGLRILHQTIQNPSLASLRALSIEGLAFGHRTATVLARARALSRVEILRLESCELTHLHLTDLLRSHNWENLRVLDLDGNKLGAKALNALAEHGPLPSLEELHLSHNLIPDDGLEHLSETPWMQNVKHLSLAHNQLGNYGVELLAHMEGFSGLRILNLQSNPISREGIEHLAQSDTMQRLNTLNLSFTHLRGGGLAPLEHAENLPSLRALHLESSGIGNEDLLALSRAPFLHNLQHLNLRNNAFNPPGLGPSQDPIAPFCEALKHHHNLKTLELAGNRIHNAQARKLAQTLPGVLLQLQNNLITAEGLEELLRQNCLAHNQTLDFSRNPIGPQGARVLSSSLNTSNIQKLVLEGCNLGDEGLLELLHSPGLIGVLSLNLAANHIGATGIEDLAPSFSSFPLLEDLDLSHNDIGNEGARTLAEHLVFPFLKGLNLSHCRISNAGARALSRSRKLNHLKHFSFDYNPISRKALGFFRTSRTLPQKLQFQLCFHGSVPHETVHIIIGSSL